MHAGPAGPGGAGPGRAEPTDRQARVVMVPGIDWKRPHPNSLEHLIDVEIKTCKNIAIARARFIIGNRRLMRQTIADDFLNNGTAVFVTQTVDTLQNARLALRRRSCGCWIIIRRHAERGFYSCSVSSDRESSSAWRTRLINYGTR